MQLASGSHIPDGLLAANALLSEKLHQGFAAPKSTLHQGFGVSISSTPLGIIRPLYDGDVRSRYTGKERDSKSDNDYFSAPNNGNQSKSTKCKIKVGVGIGLDVAGTAAGLVPGAGAALVTTQVSLGLASSAYSAYNGSVGFTIGNATGAKLSAIAGMAAQTVGWETAAKALPVIGTIYNGAVLGWDVWHANSDYQACMAGN